NYVCANGSCPMACTADTDCVATAYCRQGSCVPKDANGATCAAARSCASNFCVDGVCCNGGCDGQCEACDVGTGAGTCTAFVGAPHGARPRCPSGDAGDMCGAAQCNGLDTTSCAGFPGANIACGAATCVNGEAQAAGACDSRGHCALPSPS